MGFRVDGDDNGSGVDDGRRGGGGDGAGENEPTPNDEPEFGKLPMRWKSASLPLLPPPMLLVPRLLLRLLFRLSDC